MTSGRLFYKNTSRILKLSLPILVGQLGMIVVGFADNIMVGRYSTEALASASFVNNVFNTAILATLGFSYGLTPLVGALYARKKPGRTGMVLRMAMRWNIIFTIAIMALMTVLYFNLSRLGQPAELLPLIRPYYLLFLAGMLPISIFNVFAQWRYGVNDTWRPMFAILVANGLNVLGNWLLIYGVGPFPELGLTGAGISTLFSRIVVMAILTGYFLWASGCRPYREGWKNLSQMGARFRRKCRGKVIKTSIPVAFQLSFETGSFSAAAVMSGFLGTVSLAAFQIIVIVGTLGFCIYYSVGAAVAVLVSHGAGKADTLQMKSAARAGYFVILTCCLAASLVFYFFGSTLMGLFSNDPAVLATALSLIVPLLLYQFADATQTNFANALRGTSNVMPMLWIALISYIIIGIPATYLMAFTFGGGIYGIVLSFSVSLTFAAVLFLFYFFRTISKSKINHKAKAQKSQNP